MGGAVPEPEFGSPPRPKLWLYTRRGKIAFMTLCKVEGSELRRYGVVPFAGTVEPEDEDIFAATLGAVAAANAPPQDGWS